jgi:hypothetical protein
MFAPFGRHFQCVHFAPVCCKVFNPSAVFTLYLHAFGAHEQAGSRSCWLHVRLSLSVCAIAVLRFGLPAEGYYFLVDNLTLNLFKIHYYSF